MQVAQKQILQLRESDIRSQIRSFLRLSGYFVFINVASALSYKGLADMTAIKDGRVVWIETKRMNGKQSESQINFQRDIEQHGGEYIIARCLEDILHLCPDVLKVF